MKTHFFWPLLWLLLLASYCGAQELSIPAFPANLDLSSVEHLYKSAAYKVEVRRANTRRYHPCFVFETRNEVEMLDFFGPDPTKVLLAAGEVGGRKSDQRTASFTHFDFANTAVDVRITLLKAGALANAVTLRPLRFGLQGTISKDRKRIDFRLDSPRKISIEINDRLNPLFLFCDAPDVPDTKANYYFGPGVHRIPGDGTLVLQSDNSVYIASNAIVEGRFRLAPGSSGVSIRGRGVVSTGEWPHSSTSSTFLQKNSTVWAPGAHHFALEGLTLINASGWCVPAGSWNGVGTHDNRYVGLNMVNWNGNSDGVWISGNNNLLENCFFFTNDDALVTKGGNGTTVRNLVFWGGRWGRLLLIPNNRVDVSNLLIENVDVIGKEGERQLILVDSKGAPIDVRNVTLRNIHIEVRSPGEGAYDTVLIRARSDRFSGTLTNWLLENITLDQQFASEGELLGSDALPYKNIVFKNLRMGGRLILSPEASHITFNPNTEVHFLPPSP